MGRITQTAGIVSSLFVLMVGILCIAAALATAVAAIYADTSSLGRIGLGELFGGALCVGWFAVIPLVLVFQGGVGLLRSTRGDGAR